MTKNNLSNAAWKLRATGVLVLALALSTFPAAFSRAVKAQTPAKATAQTPAKATTSPATESKGGQKEGIKVHGHWTIDVRNPDGKLVTHREFENALDSEGAIFLSEFLGRQYDVFSGKTGFWYIGLLVPLPAGPSPWSTGQNGLIFDQNDPSFQGAVGPGYSRNLFLCIGGHSCVNHEGAPLPAPPLGTLILGGNISADSNGTIVAVSTAIGACGTDSRGPFCFTQHRFTHHPLPPNVLGLCPPNSQCEVHVVAGQIIQVTVTISFS
jgi:hypothetical protein